MEVIIISIIGIIAIVSLGIYTVFIMKRLFDDNNK